MSRGSHCMRCGLLCNVFEREGQRIYVCPGAHGQQHAEPIPDPVPPGDRAEPLESDQKETAAASLEHIWAKGEQNVPFGTLPGIMQEGLLQHLKEEEWNAMSAGQQLQKLVDIIAEDAKDSEDEGDRDDAGKHGADTRNTTNGNVRPAEPGAGTEPGQSQVPAVDSDLQRSAGVSGSE